MLSERENQYSFKEKCVAFILTLLIRSCSFAIFGVISRSKKPLAVDLGFAESFLGTMSFVMYTGRAVGTLVMCLDPATKLKRTLFMHCMLFIIFISALPIAGLTNFYPKILIGVGFCLAGFSRAYTIITYFILKEFMGKSRQEETVVSIWFSTSYLGDMSGILFIQLFLSVFQASWQVSILASLSLFLLFSILLYIFLKEVQVQNQNLSEGIIETTKEFARNIREYYRKFSNVLHSVCFTALGVIYYTILMWLPYYFLTIGYESGSSFMTIVFPISFVLGNLAYTFITSHLLKLKSTGILNFSLLLIIVIIGFVLTRLRNTLQDIPIYCILIFLVGFFMAGPEVRIYSAQLDVRVANSFQRNILFSFNLFIHHIVAALVFLGSGYILQDNIYSLFWALEFLIVICAGAYGIRVCSYPEEFKVEKAKQKTEIDQFQFDD